MCIIRDMILFWSKTVLTHMVPSLLDACDLPFSIWEHFFVEFEIAPLESFHPEAIKVEDACMDISLGHSVEKSIYRVLIILCGKTGA